MIFSPLPRCPVSSSYPFLFESLAIARMTWKLIPSALLTKHLDNEAELSSSVLYVDRSSHLWPGEKMRQIFLLKDRHVN